jgi:hypothetical protein
VLLLFAEMSEAVQLAIVNGIATVVAVAVSRYLSHREHRTTERKVSEIHTIVQNGNGAHPEKAPD